MQYIESIKATYALVGNASALEEKLAGAMAELQQLQSSEHASSSTYMAHLDALRQPILKKIKTKNALFKRLEQELDEIRKASKDDDDDEAEAEEAMVTPEEEKLEHMEFVKSQLASEHEQLKKTAEAALQQVNRLLLSCAMVHGVCIQGIMITPSARAGMHAMGHCLLRVLCRP